MNLLPPGTAVVCYLEPAQIHKLGLAAAARRTEPSDLLRTLIEDVIDRLPITPAPRVVPLVRPRPRDRQ